MSRVLTSAEILGITDTTPPLTDADVRAAVAYALGRHWRGEWLLAGEERAREVRRGDWACGGWPTDRYSVDCLADQRGLWVCAEDSAVPRGSLVRPRPAPLAARGGFIPWRVAESILRVAQTDDGVLFSLEAT